MIVGALVLGIGIYVFSTNSKPNIELAANNEDGRVEVNKDSLPNQTSSNIEQPLVEVRNGLLPKVQPKDTELEKVIEMAIADGVLTANERELIKQTALSKGVDYVKVLDDVEKRVKLLEIDSETELVDLNEKNGLDFEKFIVQKFNTEIFKIKEWAGDKFVKGVYAENTQHPDLLMQFTGYKQSLEFAVECKWRQKPYMKGIEFSTPEQLKRYKDYAKKKNVLVYMALGLGGKGGSPEKLYIVPLKDISEPFILLTELKKYEKNVGANFFFDYKKGDLK